MTDNEIIKALECCKAPHCDINICPMFKNAINTKDCVAELSKKALDLINRQKAEIERLEKHELQEAMKFNSDTINRAAKEAVKEFAELLYKRCSERYTFCFMLGHEIGQVLKKMEVEG